MARSLTRTLSIWFLLMREKDYKKICALADELLEIDDASEYRIANSWLHIKKEHPVLYSQYKRPTRFLALRLLGYIMVALRAGFSSLFSRTLFNISSSCETLIVSHLINSDQLNSLKDPYFGDLGEKKTKSSVIFVNHLKLSESRIQTFNLANKDKNIMYSSVPFLDEIKIQIGCVFDLLKILKLARCVLNRRKRCFFTRAAIEAISPSTLKALRIKYQVENILRSGSYRSLITTYEGHSYERLLYQSTKNIKSSIVSYGYHHPAIFRLEHSSARALRAEFNPDVILCTGIIGHKQMRQKMVSSWANVEVFGTHKAEVTGHTPKNICLVLPEGLIDEFEFLYKFSIEVALLKPNIKFIFRVHPRMQTTSVYQKYINKQCLPTNVSFSSQPFKEDIAQAKWAIYRGSSAIIEASRIGVVPIYAHCTDELHVDPLYELNEQVLRVNSPIMASSQMEKSINTESIMKYCQNIYSDRNLEVLL